MTRRLEVDGYARNRFRGSGKRGAQPLRTAEVDLGHAIQSLELALTLTRKARATQDQGERRAASADARERADLGVRFARAAVRGLGARRVAKPAKTTQMRLPLKKR